MRTVKKWCLSSISRSRGRPRGSGTRVRTSRAFCPIERFFNVGYTTAREVARILSVRFAQNVTESNLSKIRNLLKIKRRRVTPELNINEILIRNLFSKKSLMSLTSSCCESLRIQKGKQHLSCLFPQNGRGFEEVS